MKAFSRIGTLLAGAILLAGTAFAANKASFQLMHPTQVGDKQLAPGNYTVQWDGSGDQVQVNILSGKKSVATTTAKVVKADSASQYDNALVTVNPDGSRSLSQIRLRGKKVVLEINGANGGSGAGAAGAAK